MKAEWRWLASVAKAKRPMFGMDRKPLEKPAEGTIRCNNEGRLFWHGSKVVQLSLSNTKIIFFLAVIDFNLPPVKVKLQKIYRVALDKCCQKKTRVTVSEPSGLANAIRRWCDNKKSERFSFCTMLPVNIDYLFISNEPLLTTIKDTRLSPRK